MRMFERQGDLQGKRGSFAPEKPSLLLIGLIGLLAGVSCALIRWRAGNAGDFGWALSTARTLLAGGDPYAFTPDATHIPYPLPVALFGLPLLSLPDYFAAGIFMGLSSSLLCWGIMKFGRYSMLMLFASGPYFFALTFTQWSPLVTAAWFIPALAPLLVLIKPQIAIPIASRKLSLRGLLFAAAILVITLVVYPTWPFRWLQTIGSFAKTIPVLALPAGPLLLLAALRWRQAEGRLLLLMAIMPIRSPYDLLSVFILAKTRKQALSLVILSWVPFFLIQFDLLDDFPMGLYCQVLLLPALWMLLSPPKPNQSL